MYKELQASSFIEHRAGQLYVQGAAVLDSGNPHPFGPQCQPELAQPTPYNEKNLYAQKENDAIKVILERDQ